MGAQEIYQTPIERLMLSPRTFNCLKSAHITKVGEVLEISEAELLKIRNFSDKCLEELRHKLAERGIAFYPENHPEGDEEE
jgi:DNA-directed RNA polymerase subunit alpha